MTDGIIRRTHSLAGNSHEVGIHLAVRVLVVKYRHCVSSRSDGGKFANRPTSRDAGLRVRDGFVTVLGKVLGRRKQGTNGLAFVVAKSSDLDADEIPGSR